MPDNSSDDLDSVSNSDQTDISASAVSSAYKVIGEFSDSNGAGVLGRNDASSGTPIGVEGSVPNASGGYGLYTVDDAGIEGVLDTAETDFVVEAGTTSTGDAQNVVQGHAANAVPGSVVGGTIAGGGFDDGVDDLRNRVTDDYGTIGGGRGNQAGTETDDTTFADYATVSGGRGNEASGGDASVAGGNDNTASGGGATVSGGLFNTASGAESTVGGGVGNQASAFRATVGGGTTNVASGPAATVPGGTSNAADGQYSFAAGKGATANGDGSFVWGDSSDQGVTSDQTDEFKVQAGGGAVIFSASDLTSGVNLAPGSGSWSAWSTRTAKENVEPVDPTDALEGVRDLEISTWNYSGQDEAIRHMGPMAEAFHHEFGLGEDPERISTVDADGVAFAAIQGLSRELDQRDARIDELATRFDDLEAENESLREENESLGERLAAIEARLGVDAGMGPAPADD